MLGITPNRCQLMICIPPNRDQSFWEPLAAGDAIRPMWLPLGRPLSAPRKTRPYKLVPAPSNPAAVNLAVPEVVYPTFPPAGARRKVQWREPTARRVFG